MIHQFTTISRNVRGTLSMWADGEPIEPGRIADMPLMRALEWTACHPTKG